jgi:hypothetical protein
MNADVKNKQSYWESIQHNHSTQLDINSVNDACIGHYAVFKKAK